MLCSGRLASLTADKKSPFFFMVAVDMVLFFFSFLYVEVTARNHFSVAMSSELPLLAQAGGVAFCVHLVVRLVLDGF